jgi:anti-sigma B factor antagonist
MEPPLGLTVKQDGARPVLVVAGEIDSSTADKLMTALLGLHAQMDGAGAAIDLRAVQFIDSTGLHTLVRARDALGGKLVIRTPSEIVRRVLELTGVDFVIES